MKPARVFLFAALLFAVAALSRNVCAQNRNYHQDMHWLAPASAILQPNPLARDPDAAQGGKKLFRRHCAECHGADGTGIGRAANLQSADVQIESDGILFWKITNGNLDRGMPSFSGLPQLERWQLALYIHRLADGRS